MQIIGRKDMTIGFICGGILIIVGAVAKAATPVIAGSACLLISGVVTFFQKIGRR